MGMIRNIFFKNSSGTQINPATEESLAILRQILKNTESLQMVDQYGRLRVVLDDFLANSNNPTNAIGSGTINANITTSYAGVSTMAGQIGSYISYVGTNSQPLKWYLWDVMNNVYGSGNGKNLTRT